MAGRSLGAYEVFLADQPRSGAHRATLLGTGDAAAWASACKVAGQSLRDTTVHRGWDDGMRVEMVGWEPAPEGARCYLVGAIGPWHAMVATRLSIPTWDHVARALAAAGGSLRSVGLESRPLTAADYDMTTSGSWPWRVTGAVDVASRVTPVGDASPRQLVALAEVLSAAARTEAWMAGDMSWPTATVDDGVVILPFAVSTESIVERVYVWAQVWWAAVDELQLA